MNVSHPSTRVVALASLLAATASALGQPPELSYDPSSAVYLLTQSAAVRKELKVQDEQLAKARELTKDGGPADAKVRKALAEILEPAQLKRLEAIRLQLRGGTALVLPDVAEALDLTAAQQKEFAEVWAATSRDIDKTLKSVRFPSEKERRSYVLKTFQTAGEPMLKTLTERQREKFKELQGAAVELDKLFDPPK